MSSRTALRVLLLLGTGLSLVGAGTCDAISSRHVAQTTVLVSVRGDGVQSNATSLNAAISEDGRWVAFVSNATNLVPDQALPDNHVYVKDRLTGEIQLVSRNSDSGDVPVACTPTDVSISPDGNFVIFLSMAMLSNGSTPPTPSQPWVFYRDVRNKVTKRAWGGAWPNNVCSWPTISRNGTRIAFSSPASNLGPANPSSQYQVYFVDPSVGKLRLVSHRDSDPSLIANDWSAAARISADGNHILYSSSATDLAPGDSDAVPDTYVATIDAATAVTSELVSINPAGVKGDGFSSTGDLSADGRYVAFYTSAPNMGPGIDNVMLRDRTAGTTALLTQTADGLGPNAASNFPRMSGDGRFIVFLSTATNLTGNPSGNYQLYLTGPGTGFRLVTVNDFGLLGDAPSGVGSTYGISTTGPWIVWDSAATNLVADDTNGFKDVFTRGPFDR